MEEEKTHEELAEELAETVTDTPAEEEEVAGDTPLPVDEE